MQCELVSSAVHSHILLLFLRGVLGDYSSCLRVGPTHRDKHSVTPRAPVESLSRPQTNAFGHWGKVNDLTRGEHTNSTQESLE